MSSKDFTICRIQNMDKIGWTGKLIFRKADKTKKIFIFVNKKY